MTLHTVGVSIDCRNSICCLVNVAGMAGIPFEPGRRTLPITRRFASAARSSMTAHPKSAQAPYWSLSGLAQGARLCGAMVPGTVVFGPAYAALNATVDATWLVAMRYRADGGSDTSVFVGAGLALWVVWVASAIPGYWLGAFIADPRRFGFDLVLIVFFAAMFIPLWRGVRRAIGWAVAGVVALVVSYLVPGWWFIVIGALTGSMLGAFLDDE